MATLRIYADFNGIQASPRDHSRHAIPLDTFGSLRDLSNAGQRLHEGLRLVIYDWSDNDEDLEGNATAFFDSKSSIWIAEIDEEGYRYIPKRDRSAAEHFLCIGCRSELPLKTGCGSIPSHEVCAVCGEKASAALAPPRNISNHS